MICSTAPSESYAAQLARVSTALAAAQSRDVLEDITSDCGLGDVQRFVNNAVGERYRLLHEELAFVALAFDNFTQLVDEYLQATPRQTYALDSSDQERFLAWLRRTRVLDARQSDFVGSQQAEYACLAKARENRLAHVAFQRSWTLSKQVTNGRQLEPAQELQVNPIHVWSRLTIAGGDDDRGGEVNTIFLAIGQQVRSLWLTAEQIDPVRDLTQHNPTTLAAWTARHPRLTDREQLCEQLIDSGLIAALPRND
ncbi:MAG: hypothetical protein AB7U73_06020 [Pirellulales bacterium]